MRAHALLAVLVIAPLTDAIAQVPVVERGQRVRVTAPTLGIKKQVATFEAIEGDRLIMVADSTITISVASVTRFDVYAGRHRRPWRGAGIGFLAGAIPGYIFGLVYCRDFGDCGAEVKWGWAGFFGAGGALVGVGIGALHRADKWQQVPLDRLRVSVVPQRDGRFGLGLSVRF